MRGLIGLMQGPRVITQLITHLIRRVRLMRQLCLRRRHHRRRRGGLMVMRRRLLMMLLIRLHQSLLGKGHQGGGQPFGRRFQIDVMLICVVACGRLMSVALVKSTVKTGIALCIGHSRRGVPCQALYGASASALIPASLIAAIAGNIALILIALITRCRRDRAQPGLDTHG